MILGRRDTGVGVFLRGLISALALFDKENDYFIYHGLDAGPIDTRKAPNFRLVTTTVRNHIRSERIAWEQLVLPLRIRQDRIDVFYAPVYVKPLLVRVPTVLTIHDLFTFTHPRLCKSLNVLHYRLMVPAGVRSCAMIHCLSDWTMRRVLALWPESEPKLRHVYPGIDGLLERVGASELEAVRAKYQMGSTRPFLFVGNIEPKKNLPFLFDAMKILQMEFGSSRRLLVVGQKAWKWKESVERYRIHRLGDRVQWCGYVGRDELAALYSAALGFVFPSVCEGFGLPPLEAMKCGTPVIVSDAPALIETVGDAALVCSREKPYELARHMNSLETDRALCRELALKGRKRVATFDWGECASQIVDVFKEAAR